MRRAMFFGVANKLASLLSWILKVLWGKHVDTFYFCKSGDERHGAALKYQQKALLYD